MGRTGHYRDMVTMKRGTNGEGEEMKDRRPVVTPVANIDQSQRKPGATLSPEILEKLGNQLRGYFDGLIEPVPERFKKILHQLDKPPGKESTE
jgi:hypothetical protein